MARLLYRLNSTHDPTLASSCAFAEWRESHHSRCLLSSPLHGTQSASSCFRSLQVPSCGTSSPCAARTTHQRSEAHPRCAGGTPDPPPHDPPSQGGLDSLRRSCPRRTKECLVPRVLSLPAPPLAAVLESSTLHMHALFSRMFSGSPACPAHWRTLLRLERLAYPSHRLWRGSDSRQPRRRVRATHHSASARRSPGASSERKSVPPTGETAVKYSRR